MSTDPTAGTTGQDAFEGPLPHEKAAGAPAYVELQQALLAWHERGDELLAKLADAERAVANLAAENARLRQERNEAREVNPAPAPIFLDEPKAAIGREWARLVDGLRNRGELDHVTGLAEAVTVTLDALDHAKAERDKARADARQHSADTREAADVIRTILKPKHNESIGDAAVRLARELAEARAETERVRNVYRDHNAKLRADVRQIAEGISDGMPSWELRQVRDQLLRALTQPTTPAGGHDA